MQPHISPRLAVVVLGIAGVAGGMLLAVAWTIARAAAGQRVLPPVPPLKDVVPWGWRTVLTVVLAYGLVQALVVIGYERLKPSPPVAVKKVDTPAKKAAPTARFSFGELMGLVTAANAVMLLVVPAIVSLSAGRPRRALGFTFDGFGRNVRLGVAAFFVVTPVVMAINLLAVLVWSLVWRTPNAHPLQEMLKEKLTSTVIVQAFISAAVLAPIVEEMLFRGILQGWLFRVNQPPPINPDFLPLEPLPEGVTFQSSAVPTRGLLSRVLPRVLELPGFGKGSSSGRSSLPIILTSLLFALVHAPQMPAPIAIFFLSLALGWLREASGSLVASIVLHGLFNGLNTALMVVVLTIMATNHEGVKKQVAVPPPAVGGCNQILWSWVDRIGKVGR